jgi:DNA-binding response OmpR family regulator
MSADLAGRNVLVVEDEAIIAMLVEDMLADLGHTVAATAGRLEQALDAAKTLQVDLAILDLNLSGQPTYVVAEALQARGVPIIFATGAGSVDPAWAHTQVVQKPFQIEALDAAIRSALA